MPVGTVSVKVPVEVYEILTDYAARYEVPISQAWFLMKKEYEQRIKALEADLGAVRDEVKKLRRELAKVEKERDEWKKKYRDDIEEALRVLAGEGERKAKKR